MSQLTTEEQEIAAQLKSAELSEVAGGNINMQALGFKGGAVSKEGAETHKLMNEITNVAYKVMKNTASTLSKAKAKMGDVAQRYGYDNAKYTDASKEFAEALSENQDATLRHDMSKNAKREVGQATTKGLTF